MLACNFRIIFDYIDCEKLYNYYFFLNFIYQTIAHIYNNIAKY